MTVLSRLFSEGFRIFFAVACGFALLSMLVWEGWLAVVAAGGIPALPPTIAPHLWHAHEMIFGYGTAVLAGFFLTAVPNWTGKPGAPQRYIGLAFAIWLAGRLALWFSADLPPLAVALADLAFLPVLALKIAGQLIARPKPQQLIFLLALALLWLGNLLCHLEWLGLLRDGVAPGLRAGLLTLIAMILILGGRVTPGFTRNAMVAAGREAGLPRNPAPLAAATIAPALALPPALLLGLPEAVIAGLALLSGVAALLRLALWQGRWTLSRPILWTLHLSYALAGLGLIAFGLAGLGIGSEMAALHLLGVGGVGGMTLSVLSRASLGHSGRPLHAPPALALAYGLMPLAALARFAASALPQLHDPASLTAGALWLLAFSLAIAALWPAWLMPRPARRPVGDPPQ
jgi:uncharacterized protein involved in response to NO